MKLRGAIFDLDGTLVDSRLDFDQIRREIGGLEGPILEALEGLAPADRQRALAILNRHEIEGAARATAFPGVREFLDHLLARGVRVGVVTRNCRPCAELSLARCGLRVHTIVSREDGPVKPAPHGVLAICRQWGLEPAAVAMIGDYQFDLEAGRQAGCFTVLVTHGRSRPFAHLADLCIEHFGQAMDRLSPLFAEAHS